MRAAWAVAACALFPRVAAANGAPTGSQPPPPVIGGDNAAVGKWPDAAAILFPGLVGDEALCSGTLVAPTVVLTAGHCFDAAAPPLPDNVLIGATSLARQGDGETIAIAAGFVYPDPDTTEDITVLVLARPSSRPPRKLATGWARVDIVDGAAVTLVGYGAINKTGDQFVNELQEAHSTITDAGCTRSSGCNPAARPAGELGAGGMGIDTCPGDSGGPLYLATDYGAYLAGVTSRSYDDAQVSCGGGGIYVRTDKVIDWIERTAGVAVARGPEPQADPIAVVPGGGGDTRIAVNDPHSSAHHLEITTPPGHAMAKVRDDGAVRVCADPAAPPGDDAMTVTITDTQHTGRALELAIPIAIAGTATTAPCNIDDFASVGGCCDSGGSPGGAPALAIGVLALVMRRRR